MKNLIASICFLFALGSFGQNSQGINPEHLQGIASSESPGLTVHRIKLSTNVDLEYVEQGDPSGIPVIFLHGITDSWRSFETLLPYLPSSIHAFAITQRGHGNSDRPHQGYTPKHFASDIAAFIQQKNLGSAIIVGHSMGGVNTQQFALDYPKLSKAIVIIDSDANFKSNPGITDFYNEAMKLKGSLSWDYMNEFQKACLAKPIDSIFYKRLVDEGTKTPVRVFQAALKGIVDSDFSAELKNIECPTLIVWGDKDAFVFRDGQELFVKNIRNASLLVYEGVGHSPQWEEPARLANDLLKFIHVNFP